MRWITTKSSRSRQRRGVASFEFVMCFPILALLFAMLYTVFVATVMKSQVTMEVRHKAWLGRSDPQNSVPFGILQAHASGQSTAELTRRVMVYRKLYPRVPRDVTWANVVLTGSWDYREVKFNNGSLIYPHVSVLSQMIMGGVNVRGGDIGAIGRLKAIPGLQ